MKDQDPKCINKSYKLIENQSLNILKKGTKDKTINSQKRKLKWLIKMKKIFKIHSNKEMQTKPATV